MSDEARFILKSWQSEFGPKSGPKLGFLSFSKVWFIVFLEIRYNDSLQQCLTFSRGKIHEKHFWGPNLDRRGQNQAQN